MFIAYYNICKTLWKQNLPKAHDTAARATSAAVKIASFATSSVVPKSASDEQAAHCNGEPGPSQLNK